MSTIKKLDIGVSNFGNLIVVKKYLCTVIGVDNFSVAFLPIALINNGGVHSLFDLTHWSGVVEDFLSIRAGWSDHPAQCASY
jgi:hypothetical protein